MQWLACTYSHISRSVKTEPFGIQQRGQQEHSGSSHWINLVVVDLNEVSRLEYLIHPLLAAVRNHLQVAYFVLRRHLV